ncbi:MAG: hypothetical protein WC801_05950 [Patescibacteria group bacterium]|jgi:hypothetical protein
MKIIITLLSLGLLLTGCTNNNSGQTQNNTNEQVPEQSVLETQEVQSTNEAQNIEGDLYYIKNVSTKDGKTSIEIDKIEWLSFTDNTCSTPPEIKPDMPQCNPNGFLIKNSSPDLKTYEVLPSASLRIIDPVKNPANKKISLQEFGEYFTSQKEYFEFAPFVIQIENSVVIAIQEKYIP